MIKPLKINQIWVGSELSQKYQLWTGSIKDWAAQDGIAYQLWNMEDLKHEFPDEPIWAFVNRFPDSVRKWTLLSDYFRYILLSNGCMYLDADFQCFFKPKINMDGRSALHLGEFWDSKKICSGLLCWQMGFLHGDKIKEAARQRVAELPDNWADDMPAALGPEWLRQTYARLGINPVMLSRQTASHKQWRGRSALIHQGAGEWVKSLKIPVVEFLEG